MQASDILVFARDNVQITVALVAFVLAMLIPLVRSSTGRRKANSRLGDFGGPSRNARRRKKKRERPSALGEALAKFSILAPTRRKLTFLGLENALASYVLLVLAVGMALPLVQQVILPKFENPLPEHIVYICSVFAVHFMMGQNILTGMVERRREKLKMQMPIALDTVVRVLRVGKSIEFAIQVAADQVPAPLSSELKAITRMVEFGTPPERAMRAVAAQLDLPEFDFFCASYAIHLETGGDLTQPLDNLSKMVRDRITLKQKAEALVAEAKMSAYIIGVLPFAIAGFMYVKNPNYMGVLFSTATGNTWLLIAVCLTGTGVWVIRRMTRMKL